jgi:hypothetical protein
MIINNKELIELFGSEKNKAYYKKTKRVEQNTKISILNNIKNEYKIVEDLGRGRYKIDEKINSSAIIPNNKMVHPIYGNLLPSIMINVKQYHDSSEVFCLSLNSIYSKFNMIHGNNYPKMYSRRHTTSDILNINFDTLNEFFEVTHRSLKYYLENSIKILESLKLIRCRMIPYVSLINAETEHKICNVDTDLKVSKRRATKEEEQFIIDSEKNIRNKYNIGEGKRIFGIPQEELKNILNTINIEYYYDCYELLCLDKESVNNIVEFYNVNNLEKLSETFRNNFIDITIANAEIRHEDAITQNLTDFYRFSKSYIDDFMNLSDITINTKHKNLMIPSYNIDSLDDGIGNLSVKIKKAD